MQRYRLLFLLRKRVMSICRKQGIDYAPADLQRHSPIHVGIRHDSNRCSGKWRLVGTWPAGVFSSRRTVWLLSETLRLSDQGTNAGGLATFRVSKRPRKSMLLTRHRTAQPSWLQLDRSILLAMRLSDLSCSAVSPTGCTLHTAMLPP